MLMEGEPQPVVFSTKAEAEHDAKQVIAQLKAHKTLMAIIHLTATHK
jgi:hypothetical protein